MGASCGVNKACCGAKQASPMAYPTNRDIKLDPVDHETGPDWEGIAASLPYQKNAAQKQRRQEIWDEMDVNGNGYLSLAEIDKGLRDTLKADDIFDAKPVIMRAFQAAKNYGNQDGVGADYVEKKEFRILLEYLYMYFGLFQHFNSMDEDHDQRLTLEEFSDSLPLLSQWGITVAEEDAEETFNRIDTNSGGKILFEEFCDWAISENMTEH